MINNQIQYTMTALAISILLSACGGSEISNTTSSNLAGGNAVLSVDLVDAPVDFASNVYVNIVGMQLQGPEERVSYVYCLDEPTETTDTTTETTDAESDSLAEGSDSELDPTEIAEANIDNTDDVDEVDDSMEEHSAEQPACASPETRKVDLLALTDGAAERLLDGVVIPAGKYQWIRLQLADDPGTIVLEDGTEHDLVIPSGNQTGLKLTGGFDAYNDEPNHLVLDFDLRKSVVKAGSKYLLKPTIKISRINNAAEQTLSGSWLYTEATDCVAPMAYLYEGADITPDDYGGIESEPTVSVDMTPAEDGLGWTWTAPWLKPADYTIAYTCNGESDNPEVDDDIEFRVQSNETVNGA